MSEVTPDVPLPERRPAAVAVVVRPGAGGGEVLVVRRAIYATDPWSGHFALPGGRREPDDTSLEQTARRETREETGIDLRDAPCLAVLPEVTPRTVRRPAVVVHPFVFRYTGDPAVQVSPELAEAFWLSLGELRRPEAWSTVKVTAGGASRSVRGFRHAGGVIWGITERVLAEFLSRGDLLATLGCAAS